MNEPNISARILADSINPAGVRLTSFLLRYPRFIHSEFMTHRCFSRNAASSRAIPLEKMIAAISSNEGPLMLGDCARPEYWGAEQKGMQSGGEVEDKGNAENEWVLARNTAVVIARHLAGLGVHKSIANRLLEPFAHITVLATATEAGLANFFSLRAHPDAQPEFQVLAYRMLDAYVKSNPRGTHWGEWHIPSFGGENFLTYQPGDKLKIATARCARLSYLTHDGEHSPEKDIELHDRLVGPPFHASPFEHCAQANNCMALDQKLRSNFDNGEDCSQWLQYRKTFPQENVTQINPAEILARKPEWIQL